MPRKRSLWIILAVLLTVAIASVVLLGHSLYFPPSNYPALLQTNSITVNVEQPNCGNPCTIAIRNSNFVVNEGTQATQTTTREITFSSGTLDSNSIAVVQVGTKVTWINQDNPGTDVIATNSSLWNPVTLLPGESFSFTFNSTGTYDYHSQVNPSSGIIVVISG